MTTPEVKLSVYFNKLGQFACGCWKKSLDRKFQGTEGLEDDSGKRKAFDKPNYYFETPVLCNPYDKRRVHVLDNLSR